MKVAKKLGTGTNNEVTRRDMLTRLGLAATAIYAAPVLLPLSEARASGVGGGSHSGPSGRRRRRRRVHGPGSGPSFSGGRVRKRVYGAEHRRRKLRRLVGSFSR